MNWAQRLNRLRQVEGGSLVDMAVGRTSGRSLDPSP